MQAFFGLVAVFALVFMNGFFVAAEFSLVGARRTRITQLADEGHAGAKSAKNAIEHLDSYIAATQLGITLASLALGWIGEPAVAHLFEPLLELFLPEKTISTAGHTMSVAVAFTIVTMLHIVLGELAPKSIALQRPEGTSVIVSRPTTIFLKIFNPVIHVMNLTGNTIVRLIGFEPVGGHGHVHSAEELEMLVKSSREAGLLQESEEKLLRRVFDFSDIHAQEIMQPRVEVDALPAKIGMAQLLEIVKTEHHSRYPVYDASIDNVVGILYVKDLLDTLIAQPELLTNLETTFDLASITRKPLFVPATVGVDKLLETMQKNKIQIAVIIDEYGGMAGVATMEDILEELVGDVQDEFDTTEAAALPTQDGDIAVVDGLTSLNEISDRFGKPDNEDYISNTIGGYITERLDRIPEVGDCIQYNEYVVCVEEMDGMRVVRVRFKKNASKLEDI
ncbi:MAG: HlyC/CorC family transporter [Anaerolineae bacterium]|nr:MAG: HlyC/CorC family transporter [Anaerolineae bacterium]